MENIIIISLLLLILALVTDSWRLNRSHQVRSVARRVLLDTSVLIDGRILDLAKTGFLSDELVIPRSVLAELQLLADGGNSDKRARARFGMDVITELQKVAQVTVSILPDDRRTPEGVDNRLLELAKNGKFALATVDYNLNKIATVEGLTVLNINELAKVIRMQVLPGEKMPLQLIQEGQGRNQAVGYLEDGSMVVVSDGKKSIGQTVEVEIVRSLQTDAGKMIFANVIKSESATAAVKEAPIAKPIEGMKPQESRNHQGRTNRRKQNHHSKRVDNSKHIDKAKRADNLKREKISNEVSKKSSEKVATKHTHNRRSKSRQDEYLDRIINDSSTK